jgi:hypothetical protein
MNFSSLHIRKISCWPTLVEVGIGERGFVRPPPKRRLLIAVRGRINAGAGSLRFPLDHRSHFRHGPPGLIEIGAIGASSLPFQVCRSNRAPRLIHLLIDCLLHSWSPETDYTAPSLDLPRHHRLHRIHVTVLLEFLLTAHVQNFTIVSTIN